MKTIYLNTYDPAGRFNLDDDDADALFDAVESNLERCGWDVKRICALVDGYEQGSDEALALAAAFKTCGDIDY